MPRVDRRTFLLIAAAAVGATGCTDRSADPRPSASAPPTPTDPDEALRRRVAESEAALIATYRAALADFPELAPTLEPILRQHSEHLERVAPGWTPPPPPAESPVPTTSGSPAGESPAARPAARPGAVLSDLAAAESAARDQRIAACDAAVDPALARELCLIGASEAQHAAVLAQSTEGGTP